MALDNYVGARDLVDSIRIPNNFTIDALSNLSERVTVLKSELQQLNDGINAVIVNADSGAVEDNYWSLAELNAKIQAISATGTDISSQQYLLNLSNLSSTVVLSLDSTNTSTIYSYDRSSTSTLGFNEVDITFNVDTSTAISSVVSINIDESINSFTATNTDNITTYSTQIKPEESKLGIKQVAFNFNLESTSISLTPDNMSDTFQPTNSLGFKDITVVPALEELTVTTDNFTIGMPSELIASNYNVLGYSKVILPQIVSTHIKSNITLVSTDEITNIISSTAKIISLDEQTSNNSQIISSYIASTTIPTFDGITTADNLTTDILGTFIYTLPQQELYYSAEATLSEDQQSMLVLNNTTSSYALNSIIIPRILSSNCYSLDITSALASGQTDIIVDFNNIFYKQLQITVPTLYELGATFADNTDICIFKTSVSNFIPELSMSEVDKFLNDFDLNLNRTRITGSGDAIVSTTVDPVILDKTEKQIDLELIPNLNVAKHDISTTYLINKATDHQLFSLDTDYSAPLKITLSKQLIDTSFVNLFEINGLGYQLNKYSESIYTEIAPDTYRINVELSPANCTITTTTSDNMQTIDPTNIQTLTVNQDSIAKNDVLSYKLTFERSNELTTLNLNNFSSPDITFITVILDDTKVDSEQEEIEVIKNLTIDGLHFNLTFLKQTSVISQTETSDTQIETINFYSGKALVYPSPNTGDNTDTITLDTENLNWIVTSADGLSTQTIPLKEPVESSYTYYFIEENNMLYYYPLTVNSKIILKPQQTEI